MGHAIVLGFGFCIGVVLFLLFCAGIGAVRNAPRRPHSPSLASMVGRGIAAAILIPSAILGIILAVALY